MNDLYFVANFHFSKDLPESIKRQISDEFMRLRNYAVDALNPHYERWNSEYTGPKFEEDNGKAYNDYICRKQREVLKKVNTAHPSKIIELDCAEDCDICARSEIYDVTIRLTLKPVNQ